MASHNDIEPVYRGAACTLRFSMVPPTDISIWTIRFTLRLNANDPTYILQRPATLDDALNGVFSFQLTHDDTVVLLGNYAYDCARVDDGSEATLSLGTLTVAQEVLYP